jgi:hypothetical protein
MLKNLSNLANTLVKSINLSVFLTSLFLGLLYIYYFDSRRKVEVYPTPFNSDKIEYKDEAENCYSYKVDEIECPKDEKLIENLPIQ